MNDKFHWLGWVKRRPGNAVGVVVGQRDAHGGVAAGVQGQLQLHLVRGVGKGPERVVIRVIVGEATQVIVAYF